MDDVTQELGGQHPHDRLYRDALGQVAKVRVGERLPSDVPGHIQWRLTGVAADAQGKRADPAGEVIPHVVVIACDSATDVAAAIDAARRELAARVHHAARHAVQALAVASDLRLTAFSPETLP